jgi:LysR family glycine cleavage system transcriptional activator
MRRISESSPNSVTLRAPAQVARLWLAPRLAELGPAFPQLSLCVRTDGPGGQEAEITLQSTPPRPGTEAVILSEGVRQAYASPAFLRRHPLSTPEALLSAPLLIEQEGADWAEWFAAAGVEVDGALHGVRFDDQTGLAIDAAVRGLGVTLAEPLCVHDAVVTGDLVVVCGEVETTATPLWAVWPAEHPKLRLIEPVAAWLAKETDAALASSVVAHRELARLSA